MKPQYVYPLEQWKEPVQVWGVYYTNQHDERVLMILGPEAMARESAACMPKKANPIVAVANKAVYFGIAKDRCTECGQLKGDNHG
jgi:hypothetical protein